MEHERGNHRNSNQLYHTVNENLESESDGSYKDLRMSELNESERLSSTTEKSNVSKKLLKLLKCNESDLALKSLTVDLSPKIVTNRLRASDWFTKKISTDRWNIPKWVENSTKNGWYSNNKYQLEERKIRKNMTREKSSLNDRDLNVPRKLENSSVMNSSIPFPDSEDRSIKLVDDIAS